jgi:DNA polymerase type B, organellar and viral
MVFSYTIKKGRTKDKVTFDNTDLRYQNFQDHKLPITMNPLEYGKLIRKIDNIFIVQINKTNLVDITQEENINIVKLFVNTEEVLQYKDIKINNYTFERYLGNQKFIFKNGELVLLSIEKSVKFINPLLLNTKLTNKIITFDIETLIKDNVHVPYAISWYDGEIKKSYVLSDISNSEEMIKNAIKDIMIKKYDNYKIYIHNLSGFDAIFLLKILTELGQIKPIMHKGDLISIEFKFNGYIVTFKDSLKLLIVSLRNLAKSFGVDTQKGIFPYTFVNENNLDYIGPVPDIKYFNNISKNEYNEYKANFINKN